ncbi:MAG: hypothetical protein H0X29_06555 [Parachlamydiaceae bacterium]|nr:hypothetical protein [Parachlamydiaceae bacterium]
MNFNRDDSTPIRFTPGRENKYNTDDNQVGTRPAGDPRSSKNFQKILSKDSDENEDKEEKTGAVDDEDAAISAMVSVEEKILKKRAPTSLFDLSGTSSSKAPSKMQKPLLGPMAHSQKNLIADAKNEALSADEEIVEDSSASPAELYSQMKAKEPKKIEVQLEKATPTDLLAERVPIKKDDKLNKFNSRFATEQTDLSYVNPLALNTIPIQSTNITTEKATLPAMNIQDIIDQLVEKVVQMETSGSTDTVVTLKSPPILAGADLVVTGFDSAKGEFNITFQKLTQAAKDMLDMKANQQSLLLALEQKGYAVHIVTTTTLAEINLPDASGAAPQDRDRDQDQQGQQKQRDKQQK